MHREEKDTMYKATVRMHSILKSDSEGIVLYVNSIDKVKELWRGRKSYRRS